MWGLNWINLDQNRETWLAGVSTCGAWKSVSWSYLLFICLFSNYIAMKTCLLTWTSICGKLSDTVVADNWPCQNKMDFVYKQAELRNVYKMAYLLKARSRLTKLLLVCFRFLTSRCEIYELNETLDKKWQWFDVPVFWRHNSCSKLHQHTLILSHWHPRITICSVLTLRRTRVWNICLSGAPRYPKQHKCVWRFTRQLVHENTYRV